MMNKVSLRFMEEFRQNGGMVMNALEMSSSIAFFGFQLLRINQSKC